MSAPENISQISEQNSVRISIINQQNFINAPEYNLESKSVTPNLAPTELFIDHQFKLIVKKETPHIKLKRISEIYPHNTSLFVDLKDGKELTCPTKSKINSWSPSFLSEINMLPFQHFSKLIEPLYINSKGFYQVSVCRNGIMVKQIIDDMVYFDEKTKTIISHPQLEQHPWVHIVVKMWAKLNKGYQNLYLCHSFDFVKTFSFPDWEVMNPNKEKKQVLIAKLTKATNKSQYLIAKTKSNPNVGCYGFIPDCSFVIKGHYQEYGDIYVRVLSYTLGGWNGQISSQGSPKPEEKQDLAQNESLIPIEEFLNLFHLIYSTTNKYFQPVNTISLINYQKYTLNVDAMQKNALTLGLNVQTDVHQINVQVGLCFYFPEVKIFDLVKNEHSKNQLQTLVVPWSKIMIGKTEDNAQANFIQSMRESLMKCTGQGQITYNMHKNSHQYIYGTYFRGHSKDLCINLSLKPGKYIIRLKIEHIISEYRCFVSSVAINGIAKFYDPKLQHNQQINFLQDCLFRKAVSDKKHITFINPAKRGSWISCRNEYDSLGYCYIAIHVIKNADNKILIKVSPKVLKQNGYIMKQHKDSSDFQIVVDSEENTVLVIREDRDWKGTKRVWPVTGIQFIRVPRVKKVSDKQSLDISA